MASLKQYIVLQIARRLHASLRRYQDNERLARLKQLATFDETVSIGRLVELINHQGSREAITFGAHSVIRGQCMVLRHSGKIALGKHVFLGENSRIWSGQSISVGNHVLISHNVNIHDTDSHPARWDLRRVQSKFVLETMTLPNSQCEVSEQPIIIEDDVWVGFNASILKGVHVGRGAIIAAGSLVTRDVPAFAVVMGNPAAVKRQMEPDERLECSMEFPLSWTTLSQ